LWIAFRFRGLLSDSFGVYCCKLDANEEPTKID
jgi:hypothetical protein